MRTNQGIQSWDIDRSDHTVRTLLGIFSAVAAAHAPAIAGQPQYHIQVFPALEGFPSAFPTGMAESGKIVGYAGSDPFDPVTGPFETLGNQLSALAFDEETFNQALACNSIGQVVGISGLRPFVWENGSGDFLPALPGYFHGSARDVNESGVIVGLFINDLIGFDVHCYWTSAADEPVQLTGLTVSDSGAAHAVNNAGQIAGASASPGGGFIAVRWDDPNADPISIGPLPGGINSEALGINDLGDIAGRSAFPDNTVHPFLYVSAFNQLIDLGVLGGDFEFSVANDVNNQRQVVGFSTTDTFNHGFLWQDGVLHDLNDLISSIDGDYSYITSATKINERGQIAVEVAAVDGQKSVRRLARLTPDIPGDLDRDVDVDLDDLRLFTECLGGQGVPVAAGCTAADLDDDGDADLADAGGLFRAFGD